jgi:hypothetical protein
LVVPGAASAVATAGTNGGGGAGGNSSSAIYISGKDGGAGTEFDVSQGSGGGVAAAVRTERLAARPMAATARSTAAAARAAGRRPVGPARPAAMVRKGSLSSAIRHDAGRRTGG